MWVVVLLAEVEEWYFELDEEDTSAVTAAIDLLAEHGPQLGRPTVDRIKGSSRHNLKEFRPAGTSIRILFVFDPMRQAVLLVAGDKAGQWQRWYRETSRSPKIDIWNGWRSSDGREEGDSIVGRSTCRTRRRR